MKYVNTKQEATSKLQKGINIVADIVGSTLGPCGSNVILRKPYNIPVIVNDGVSIAREIELQDPTENAGADLLTSAASCTNAAVGDGTTTTCILTQSLVNHGFEAINTNQINPILLREELKHVAEQQIYPELDKIIEKISNHAELEHVATISVGGNEVHGKLVAEALKTVGTEGIINIENNPLPYTCLDMVHGYKIDRGYMTPYAINDTEKFKVDYDNCLVLCCYHKISDLKDVETLMRWSHESGKPVLLIAEDIDESVFAALQINLMRKAFRICPVKSPGFGFNVRDYMNDIAKLTGCTVFAEDTKHLSSFSPDDFGSAKRVIATREYTCILRDPEIEQSELDQYVKSLKNQLDHTENEHMKDSIKERISKLTVGIATMSVGAQTETEQAELKLRIEDAINAARAALRGGIVPGGAATFSALAAALSDTLLMESSQERTVALTILIKTLRMPERILILNSGISLDDQILYGNRKYNEGYNAKTKQWCVLKDEGIIDPALVIKAAIENSISIASTILTTQATIIAEDKE